MEPFDIPPPPPAILPNFRATDHCSTPPKKRPKKSPESEDPLNWLAGRFRILSTRVEAIEEIISTLEAMESRLDHVEAQFLVPVPTVDAGDRSDTHMNSRMSVLEENVSVLRQKFDDLESGQVQVKFFWDDCLTSISGFDSRVSAFESNLTAEVEKSCLDIFESNLDDFKQNLGIKDEEYSNLTKMIEVVDRDL